MSSQENKKQMISNESQLKMIEESYHLIRRLSSERVGEHGKYKLFLHDSSSIEYRKFLPIEIERFYDIVKRYGGSFVQLVQNLQTESMIQKIETDHVIGSIDVQMTRSIRQTGSNNVVCISHTKNLFIPENVLLGAIIFGISSLTEKLQRELTKWGEKHDVNKNHLRMLEEVSSFSYFLQKDRFVSRLVKNYNVNYNTIDLLLQKVLNRKNFGKITPKYQKLIEFLQMWKHWDKILRDNSSLEIKLQGFLNELNAPKLYECWLFYKMLASYGEMKQSRKVTIFSNGKYEIQYQWRKTIGWTKVGGTEIPRIPDIMIKKNGTIVAVIDAKYMDGNEELENNVEGGKMPDSKIVNQMIIAMDYGTKKNNVDLGIVMFADKQDSVRIIIEKDGTNKKIYFLNVHPETNPERALEEIKKIIS